MKEGHSLAWKKKTGSMCPSDCEGFTAVSVSHLFSSVGGLVGISYRLSGLSRRMTIQHGSAEPDRSCSREGNERSALRWDLSPPEIRNMTDGLISRVKKVYDEVGALKVENVTIENTLKALADVRLEYACESLFFPFRTLHTGMNENWRGRCAQGYFVKLVPLRVSSW